MSIVSTIKTDAGKAAAGVSRVARYLSGVSKIDNTTNPDSAVSKMNAAPKPIARVARYAAPKMKAAKPDAAHFAMKKMSDAVDKGPKGSGYMP